MEKDERTGGVISELRLARVRPKMSRLETDARLKQDRHRLLSRAKIEKKRYLADAVESWPSLEGRYVTF